MGKIIVSGLLFSGLLISALGATMDVAMSVSSAMEEIAKQNPNLSMRELWLSGSFGIVLSVPLTVTLCAFIMKQNRIPKKEALCRAGADQEG